MENYYLYVLMSVLLILLPGPDMGLLTQNTITNGRKGGYKTVSGILLALVLHILAAIFGLSAVIVNSATLFAVLKYIGAIYLIYLGIVSLYSIRKRPTSKVQIKNNRNHSPLLQGLLTNLLNPKVAIFFLTFLPQFVSPDNTSFVPFLIMGVTYLLLTAIWFLTYVTLLSNISQWLQRPTVQNAISGISGIALLGFGIKLALERK